MDTNEIKWLFFDVGGTLVDEKEAFRRRIRETIAIQKALGNEYTEEQLETAMRMAALAGKSYFRGAMKSLGLSRFAPYDAVGEKLYGDVKPVLEALCRKYKLGIIANQPLGTEGRLQHYGIRDYFSVILSSEEEGISKPDPELFRRALLRSGCPAENAWMIGDRPDNDIAPAKALGMKTVRVRQGLGGLMPVTSEELKADHTVDSLTELLSIFG